MKNIKMVRKNKKKSVDSHFGIRCLQRLGYIPNKEYIIRDIQTGKLKIYDRQSNRVTRWLWTCPLTGTECIIPYDKERKQLITVLFKDIDYK